MRKFPKANIVVSGIEHDSVLAAARHYDCRVVKVRPDGRVYLDDLRTKIDANTALVSVMYANNEVGTIQPVREVAKLVDAARQARKTKLPLYFHSDAAQATNYLDLHVARLGVDLLTINGGKIYGPKQSGALYVKAGLMLEPLVYGGGQERGLRSGTENIAGAVGLAKALDLVQTSRHVEAARLQALQQEFFKLIEAQIPQAVINGSRKWRLPNNVHVTVPGTDNERLLIKLEQAGVLAAAGSACSASNEEPSHVLKSLGLTDQEAQASLRFTMGRETTNAMVEKTVKSLEKLI
jgi:cysteine desulfurase